MIRELFTTPTCLVLAWSLLGCSQVVSSGVGAVDAGPSVDRETSAPSDLPAAGDAAVDMTLVIDGDSPTDAVPPLGYPINLGDDQRLFLFEGATVLRMPDGRVYGWGNRLAEVLQDASIGFPRADLPPRGAVLLSLDFARYRYVFGYHFACRAERTGDRAVSCRGTNENAALGVLTDAGGGPPYFDWQPVPGMTNVRALAASGDFVCAWNDRVWCWGHRLDVSNQDELIGRTPVPLRSVAPRTVLSQWGTYPVCVSEAAGALWCLGYEGFETDPTGAVNGPTWWRDFMRVDGVRDVGWVSRKFPSATLMIDGEGALWCRGRCRVFGFDTVAPRRVEGLPPLRQIVEARESLIAVTRDGRLLSGGGCSEFNISDYCLGLPRRLPILRPLEPATFVSDVVEASASSSHVCVLNRDGELWCWGGNQYYQITNASSERTTFFAPSRVSVP